MKTYDKHDRYLSDYIARILIADQHFKSFVAKVNLSGRSIDEE